MSEPTIEKTTLGRAMQIAPLLTPDGEPLRMVDASKPCWIVWPVCIDDQCGVYLNEAEALFERDRQIERAEEDAGEENDMTDEPTTSETPSGYLRWTTGPDYVGRVLQQMFYRTTYRGTEIEQVEVWRDVPVVIED